MIGKIGYDVDMDNKGFHLSEKLQRNIKPSSCPTAKIYFSVGAQLTAVTGEAKVFTNAEELQSSFSEPFHHTFT
jgi:hypothetical protein